MTDDQDEQTERGSSPVDGPTNYGPTTGHLRAGPPQQPTVPADEPTARWDDPSPELPAAEPDHDVDGGPTVAFTGSAPGLDGTTTGPPSLADDLFDEQTAETGRDEATTTGPTVGGWPSGHPEPPPPGELIWRVDQPRPETRGPAYYVGLGATVVLVVGLLAVAAIMTVVRPERKVTGTALPEQTPPSISAPASEPPPSSTSEPGGPAEHPLSTSTARMPDVTCDLPRFDPADDGQAAFYAAAKKCADNAWRNELDEAGLRGGVKVVTVTSAEQTSCGEITPTSPATHCEDTVYLTPAHLRDTERNGRYPGKYLGVLLREYAGALQHTTGLTALPTVDSDEGRTRLAQQATCLAGVVSGALAGRGAVDSNITGEIADRLSTVDAPPDAKSWLDKGFTERTPAACNTWAG